MALPVAVVTGANSGLGLALAVKLASSHRVFAGMRSLAKKDSLMEAASKASVVENVKPVELDVNTATWCVAFEIHEFSKNWSWLGYVGFMSIPVTRRLYIILLYLTGICRGCFSGIRLGTCIEAGRSSRCAGQQRRLQPGGKCWDDDHGCHEGPNGNQPLRGDPLPESCSSLHAATEIGEDHQHLLSRWHLGTALQWHLLRFQICLGGAGGESSTFVPHLWRVRLLCRTWRYQVSVLEQCPCARGQCHAARVYEAHAIHHGRLWQICRGWANTRGAVSKKTVGWWFQDISGVTVQHSTTLIDPLYLSLGFLRMINIHERGTHMKTN